MTKDNPDDTITPAAEKTYKGLSTLCVHAGESRQKPGNAITDAIFCTSTYTFANTQEAIDSVAEKRPREEYSRYGNPSEKVAERKLAAMEGGQAALLFSSGMAAVTALLQANLTAGDEIILVDECYHRTRQFCREHLGKFGVITKLVPAGDYEAMEAAITPQTKILFTESPTNPHLSVLDMERFVEIARKHNLETVVDATLATPYNIRPLEYGVDYVMHSATKYLSGHNDVLCGAIIGSTDKIEVVRKLRGVTGSIGGPHNIYLLLRGLKTFELRMQRHNENGMALAKFLSRHPRIEKVLYPGLPSHPYHAVAKRTMRGFGSLVTFYVKGANWRQTADVVDAVSIPRIGPSLGGVESIIEQPIIMSYHDFTIEQRRAVGIADNMIRLSCGIENSEDLIDDIECALKISE